MFLLATGGFDCQVHFLLVSVERNFQSLLTWSNIGKRRCDHTWPKPFTSLHEQAVPCSFVICQFGFYSQKNFAGIFWFASLQAGVKYAAVICYEECCPRMEAESWCLLRRKCCKNNGAGFSVDCLSIRGEGKTYPWSKSLDFPGASMICLQSPLLGWE